jgi:hypothetical protein
VLAGVFVYPDLREHKKGVYTHTGTESSEFQPVKIVGFLLFLFLFFPLFFLTFPRPALPFHSHNVYFNSWGEEEDGTPYWIVQNSFVSSSLVGNHRYFDFRAFPLLDGAHDGLRRATSGFFKEKTNAQSKVSSTSSFRAKIMKTNPDTLLSSHRISFLQRKETPQ